MRIRELMTEGFILASLIVQTVSHCLGNRKNSGDDRCNDCRNHQDHYALSIKHTYMMSRGIYRI